MMSDILSKPIIRCHKEYGMLLFCIILLFLGCECDQIQPPWSGWWWPWIDANTCRLYNNGGPAEKYDLYVKAKTGTSPSPDFKTWEKNNHDSPNVPGWFGHCHALAAASILFKEPTKAKTKLGVNFTVLDLKGLLTEVHYQFTTTMVVGKKYEGPGDDINDPSPDKFHKALQDWLYTDPKSIAFDIDTKELVNTHVIYNYYIKKKYIDSNDPNKTHVETIVYYVDYGVCDPNYTGTVTGELTYYYWIKGPVDNPISGEWEGASINNHPDFLWRPGYATKVLGRPLDFFIVGEIGEYEMIK